MIGLGVGLSRQEEAARAAREAWDRAAAGVGRAPTLALLFFTPEYAPEELVAALPVGPGAPLVGCTVAGLVAGEEVHDRGVLVAALAGEGLRCHLDAAAGLGGDQRAAGAALGERLAAALEGTEEEALLLVLADCAATLDASGLVAGLAGGLGARVRYAGGGAGDNLRPLATRQVLGGRVLREAAVAALLLGPGPFGVALAHGWCPVSLPLIVTRARGNTIEELDWQEATAVYARSLAAYDPEAAGRLAGEGFAAVSLRYPLGIPQARGGDSYVVRDPIRAGPDGSLTCVGEVPENAVVRLMSADREDMAAAAEAAAAAARAELGGRPAAGGLLFYCVSRRLLLGDGCRRELAAVQGALGEGVPLAGCLTFGEIGAAAGGPPAFHNKSLVVCALPA